MDVDVLGSYAYVLSNYNGVSVLRIGPGATPIVTTITPSMGTDAGIVSITDLTGANFEPGAAIKLTRPGYPDITGINAVTVSSTKVTCAFDLKGKAPGLWNVVVTNPGGVPFVLSDAFTINDVTPPAISSIQVSPTLVAADAKVTVRIQVTDNIGVTSVTANCQALAPMAGNWWGGDLKAEQSLGAHAVALTASDASGNS
jgi:hypothetical protein